MEQTTTEIHTDEARPALPARMTAILHERYGRPADALRVGEVELPEPADDQVLIRVRATSLNASEWYAVTGPLFARPGSGLRRPKSRFVAGDVAGTVELVGKDVTGLRPGDEVLGTSGAAWAEYAPAREVRLARKPAGVSFEDAAGLPIAGITALQAIRKADVQPGQKVLINGASGGVGTYALQLAKVFGADVTAVCSTRNVEQARTLGADRVVDYTREDFTRLGIRHDAMLDVAGSRRLSQVRRVLTPKATIMMVGGPMTYRGLGPLPHIGGTFVAALFRSQKLGFFVAKINDEDLAFLAQQVEAGKLRTVIDREYGLSRLPEALTYFGEGHARAKVVVTA
jgi:NADPH:quinone reductase-like Zn-dependent oxidoreductase